MSSVQSGVKIYDFSSELNNGRICGLVPRSELKQASPICLDYEASSEHYSNDRLFIGDDSGAITAYQVSHPKRRTVRNYKQILFRRDTYLCYKRNYTHSRRPLHPLAPFSFFPVLVWKSYLFISRPRSMITFGI